MRNLRMLQEMRTSKIVNPQRFETTRHENKKVLGMMQDESNGTL